MDIMLVFTNVCMIWHINVVVALHGTILKWIMIQLKFVTALEMSAFWNRWGMEKVSGLAIVSLIVRRQPIHSQ